MDGVLVAIPAFNEARTIGTVVRLASRHGPVLVVDDGSSDGTAEAARAAGASVISHARRRGKGGALATAFAEARACAATRIVTLDGDGQHDPADIPALVAASAAAPRALVVGARTEREALLQDRALAMELASFWLSWTTATTVADTQSGFRVYPAALLDDVPCRGGRFVFETEVIVQALRRGWQVREVPVRTVPRAERASRFSPLRDGLAITAYLAGGATRRWAIECGAGVREVARVFSHERRVARHGRMLERAASYAGTPGWGAAVGVAACDALRERLHAWWEHARCRRARRAAVATLATPGALAIVALASAAPAVVPTVLTRAVRTVYDRGRLPALVPEAPSREGGAPAWATVAR